MWADSLLGAEQAHLWRLVLWGAASVLVGSGILAAVARRRAEAALLWHFGLQTAAWGAVDLAIAAWASRDLGYRDVDGLRALREFLWLNLGLDAGYVAVGITLGACAWAMGRRAGALGAGIGVAVQGLGLLVLDGWLVVLLNRLQVA